MRSVVKRTGRSSAYKNWTMESTWSAYFDIGNVATSASKVSQPACRRLQSTQAAKPADDIRPRSLSGFPRLTCGKMQGMSGCFGPSDRDAPMLMSPSLQEWLPADHLARFVVEAVERLDLRVIERSYAGCGLNEPAPSAQEERG